MPNAKNFFYDLHDHGYANKSSIPRLNMARDYSTPVEFASHPLLSSLFWSVRYVGTWFLAKKPTTWMQVVVLNSRSWSSEKISLSTTPCTQTSQKGNKDSGRFFDARVAKLGVPLLLCRGFSWHACAHNSLDREGGVAQLPLPTEFCCRVLFISL